MSRYEVPVYNTPEGGRPYQPIDLQTIADQMLAAGSPVLNPPIAPTAPPERGLELREHVEAFTARITEGAVATSGLFRVFSADGQLARAERRRDRIQHRINVSRIVGETMSSPRNPDIPLTGPGIEATIMATFIPSEKTGWVGTHKRTIDETALGGDERPNEYRPAARAERATSRRLETRFVRATRNRANARWLRNSVDQVGLVGATPVSAGERRRERTLTRRADRLEARAARDTRRFNNITGSNDLRGRLARRRLARATDRVERLR